MQGFKNNSIHNNNENNAPSFASFGKENGFGGFHGSSYGGLRQKVSFA